VQRPPIKPWHLILYYITFVCVCEPSSLGPKYVQNLERSGERWSRRVEKMFSSQRPLPNPFPTRNSWKNILHKTHLQPFRWNWAPERCIVTYAGTAITVYVDRFRVNEPRFKHQRELKFYSPPLNIILL